MGITDVVAALLSAMLHAGWNAAVKANRNPAQAMTAQMLLGAVLVVPALLWSGVDMDPRLNAHERTHHISPAASL
jgi:hypothetical protein